MEREINGFPSFKDPILYRHVSDGELLKGLVEVDETYIGGKPRKGGRPGKRGRGTRKTPVVGMASREDGKVRAKVSQVLTSKRLSMLIRKNVKTSDPSTMIFTDEYKGYSKVKQFAEHRSVNHQKTYSDGIVHTNTIEGFWALLKRGIIGQYHKVSVAYLQHYIDEFAFRWNQRKNQDAFGLTLERALGGAA